MKEEKTARRFQLLTEDGQPPETLNDAKEALAILRNSRRERTLRPLGAKPTLADYIETYFAKAEIARKKAKTLLRERGCLGEWDRHLGQVRIDRITTPMVASFKDKRPREVSARTVNLEQTVLRNVPKRAVNDEGYLREADFAALKLKHFKVPTRPKRWLLSPAEFERLLATVPAACEKNAVQVADYLRFLAYSGAREQEALKIRWVDVDFENERVTIGAGGVSKNHEEREVKFNDRLGVAVSDWKAKTPAKKQAGGGNAAAYITVVYERGKQRAE